MQAISRSLDCLDRPIARPSLSLIRPSLNSLSAPRQTRSLGSFYHVLLILILILYFSPASTLAQPTPNESDLTLDVPQSASLPSGEIIGDDPREGSSLYEDAAPIVVGSSNTQADRGSLERRIATNTAGTMPTPFDTLSNNFANSSCVKFVSESLRSDEVANCHPLSLLLQNSNGFFHTLSSAARTSQVLDTACSASLPSCASTMTSMAKKMLQNDNCGPDYDSDNLFVRTVYQDLMAYEPMYRATCLTNPDTTHYCFVDAVTNTTAPDGYDLYFVPLGNELRSGNVTCNQCLQAAMDVYAHWATIDGQALDTTYLPSARVVNQQCGANFANTTLTTGTPHIKSSAGVRVPFPDVQITVSLGLAIGAALTGLF
ncbi:hypothetical protein N7492_002348 [Penicillium capsulatum]|uniref:DUF7729 domain-containing protein n=1 Tax=Penicillium capsulatum TaxID=69766 RepID=A0A9W9LV22_9EURO|nr:hypothetical protein N7492_002348 [Penicillium capsulatum]KAJ6123046.1 hypothetical protein N7512_005511 [Penicillium capsulatum]